MLRGFERSLIAGNEWQWLTESPIKRLKQKESPGRIRFLSDDERDGLLHACKESKNKYLYLVALIALSTGLRLNEILSMRYADILLEKGNCLITIPATKNGHPHVIPLVGIAKQILAEHSKIRRLDTDLLILRKKTKLLDQNFPSLNRHLPSSKNAARFAFINNMYFIPKWLSEVLSLRNSSLQ